jgi:hypothetical protein
MLVRCHSVRVRRPTLDDIQRISEGKGAKTRGTGSRQVPHRLNQEERDAYNLARDKGYLTVRGSGGYRRERKGSPLANIYRQLSDAHGRPCIIVDLEAGGAGDTVLVDLSPLRQADTSAGEAAAVGVAGEAGVPPLARGAYGSPFTVIVPHEMLDLLEAAAARREGGGEGGAQLEGGPAAGGEAASEEDEEALRHLCTAPIWQQPPRLVAFRCTRPEAKALAKSLAAAELAQQHQQADGDPAPGVQLNDALEL